MALSRMETGPDFFARPLIIKTANQIKMFHFPPDIVCFFGLTHNLSFFIIAPIIG
jgi:hypothetical protein